jgi:hypothetical protein
MLSAANTKAHVSLQGLSYTNSILLLMSIALYHFKNVSGGESNYNILHSYVNIRTAPASNTTRDTYA